MSAPFEIIKTVNRGPATVLRVVNDVLMMGRDRAVLVKEADPVSEAGIFLMMLSPAAIRDIGPISIEAVKKIVSEDEVKIPEFEVTDQTKLADVFAEMAARKACWWWSGNIDAGRLYSYFLSQEICEWLAPRLTAAGCPCSLK
jgi:hypothetical protein